MAWTNWLAVVLFAAALALNIIGLRWIVRGARAAGHPDQSRMVVRGFRRLIMGGGLISFGLGFLLGNSWLHWLGAVFLCEEAIETGVMLLALRRGRTRHQKGDPK